MGLVLVSIKAHVQESEVTCKLAKYGGKDFLFCILELGRYIPYRGFSKASCSRSLKFSKAMIYKPQNWNLQCKSVSFSSNSLIKGERVVLGARVHFPQYFQLEIGSFTMYLTEMPLPSKSKDECISQTNTLFYKYIYLHTYIHVYSRILLI